MTNYAAIERAELADALLAAGPSAPTLCEGWTTTDLALHLIERDSRPDILAGTALASVPLLSSRARHAHNQLGSLPWNEIVAKVARPGGAAPARIAAIDKRLNAAEFFIHHEDIRRAQGEWTPRTLPADQEKQLWNTLKAMRIMLLRSHYGTVVLASCGYGSVSGGKGKTDDVTVVRAVPSELLMWAFGRDDHADVRTRTEES